MKTRLLLIFNLAIFYSAYCQHERDTTIQSDGDLVSVDLLYGTMFSSNSLNNEINTLQNFRMFNPIQTIGLSFTVAYVRGGKHNYGVHLSYAQIIPQTIQINDSLNGKMNGFNVSCNLIGIDITPKSSFSSIVLGAGFNAGRLRIASDAYRSQKNPFFAPALYFNPRFFIGHLAIGLRAEYQFDVTKTGWRSVNLSNKTTGFNPIDIRQTGLLTYLSVGWKF